MADPLSIAASVVGLAAAAGKIYSALSGFVSSAADAPQSALSALNTVREMRLALEMVQELINTISTLPSNRKMMVRLEHIVITISNSVLTMSELESLVCPCMDGSGLRSRFKWAKIEQRVLRLLPRLESQKASLSLMVSVLVCRSEVEAQMSRDKLNAAVEQILQRDEEFAARMRYIDDMDLTEGGRSIRFHDNESTATGLLRDRDYVLGAPAQQPTLALDIRREFEAVLEQSWVYARTSSNEIDAASITSSDVRSHAWSMLSMNDISIVAIFRLPVTLDDINCFGSGLTLCGFLGENLQHLDAPDTAETATSSDSSAGNIEDHSLFPSWEHLTLKASLQGAAELSGRSIKAVIVGDKRCEKTAAILAFTTGAKQGEYIPTVFDNHSASLMIHGRLYSLGLWDTSGQEDYPRLRPLAYPQTDVFLVFGRIGIKSTFDSIEGLWIPEINHQSPRIPILIVGISSEDDQQLFELARQRHEPCKHEDYTKMGKSLAKRIGVARYMECNISTLYNVKAVFSEAVLAVVDPKRHGQPQSRSKKSKLWRRGFLPGIGETKEE